jgi:peptide subunit release factor 1 (eRF1)
VLTNTHRGRLYAATPGSARVLKEIEEVVPKHHRASGQRRSKESGLRIERHRQDAILHFHKELAREVETAWNGAEFRGVILLGHDDGLAQFREQLPPQIASHVLQQLRYAWTGKQPQISDIVATSIADATQKEESSLLARLHTRLSENYRVAAGPQEVLDALRNGQVLSLVLGPDPGLVASRCVACHAVFAAERATCSQCQASCEKTNLWQQILTTALRHNVAVHFVKPDAAFSKRGAVAAMLSRDG